MPSENVVFGVDWNTVDKKYNWLAVDRVGDVYAYVDKPSGWGAKGCWMEDSIGGYGYQGRYSLSPSEDWTTMIAERPKTVTITIPEDVAIGFTNLIIVSDAGKAVSVAIQEALNKRYD